MREGTDIAIIANGLLVAEAVEAGELLAAQGIHARIKPAGRLRDVLGAQPELPQQLPGGAGVPEHVGAGLVVSFGLGRREPSPRIGAAVEPYPGRWTHHAAVIVPHHRVVQHVQAQAGQLPAQGLGVRVDDVPQQQLAYLPEDCQILDNAWGTAPGCAFEADGTCVVMLPGRSDPRCSSPPCPG